MANEYLIQQETLSAIADGVRDISGKTDELSPADMADELTDAGAEAATQNTSLDTLIEILESKRKGDPVLTEKSITENGTYNASDDSADGYSEVIVAVPSTPTQSKTLTLGADTPQTVTPDSGKVLSSVPVELDTSVIKAENIKKDVQMLGITGEREGGTAPVLIEKTVTQNGTYNASDDSADGYSKVEVNVSSTAKLMTTNLPLFETLTRNTLCYGKDKFVAFNSSYSFYSTDGVTWNRGSRAASGSFSSVAYGNGMFVAVSTNNGNVAAYSTNGIAWTASTLPLSGNWEAVTYGKGKFVAVGGNYSQSVAAYSSDGITWTASTMPAAGIWASIAYGNGIFVALDSGNAQVAYSTDGVTWTSSTLPTSQVTWRSVAYGNGMFVAVGANNEYSVARAAYSTDGITWTASTLPLKARWETVTYGNGIFVAFTDGTVGSYSVDGITWTAFAKTAFTPLNAVYGNGKFVLGRYGSSQLVYCDVRMSIE